MMDKRIGILGGGQLGRMLCLAGHSMDMNLAILDKSVDFPAGDVCDNFTEGDITNYDDVVQFGQDLDIITIEIEKVNIEALEYLDSKSIKVHPSPEIIKTIQDKAIQKDFLTNQKIPTAPYRRIENRRQLQDAISSGEVRFPFVQKLRKDGYDGRGVQVCNLDFSPTQFFDAPSIVEELVDIDKELAVIVSRNEKGDLAIYDSVEMVFDPDANLLDYQISPSQINLQLERTIQSLAYNIATSLNLVGNLAIELFLTKSGDIMVNEMAPRPHNSGHHTIEACQVSQYENLLRAVSNAPLGSPALLSPALLINLLGSPAYTGKTIYSGIEEILRIPNAHLHLYGKITSKPKRKMGHVTILSNQIEIELANIEKVKSSFNTAPLTK